MTITAEPPTRSDPARPPHPAPTSASATGPTPADTEPDALPPLRLGPLAAYWALITVVGVLLVLIAVGPVSEERDQRALLGQYRTDIEAASNQAFGLDGIEVPTQAPAAGDPVAIIDIDRTQLSRVVVEGTDPDQTRQGPGHVVGTGGPGQPGNSVIVGRRALFGGAFGSLAELQVGDRILVTTTQGRSVYEVGHVGTHAVAASTSADREREAATTTTSSSTPPTTVAADGTPASADGASDGTDADAPALLPDGPLTPELLYGPSADDRLTLVTTASGTPGATGEALVVVATMDGQAFAPTPQGGRTPGDDGRSGTSAGSAALLLALLTYVGAVAGTIWLHRSVPWRSAYLLSAPVLVALTVVLADQIASVLPAWT